MGLEDGVARQQRCLRISTCVSWRLGPGAASPLPRPLHSQQHVVMLHSDVCDVGAARWAWRMACATVAVPAHVDLHELTRLGPSAASSLPRPVHSHQHTLISRKYACDVREAWRTWRMGLYDFWPRDKRTTLSGCIVGSLDASRRAGGGNETGQHLAR